MFSRLFSSESGLKSGAKRTVEAQRRVKVGAMLKKAVTSELVREQHLLECDIVCLRSLKRRQTAVKQF